MEQLKMYRFPGDPIRSEPLPKGYSFSTYQTDADKLAWCECCKNGLIAADAGEDAFRTLIESVSGMELCRDVFFLDCGGVHVGTITVYVAEDNIGYLHMAGILTAFRGKGLCKFLIRRASEELESRGVSRLVLTTDDWRKSAVRTYIKEGFRPVEYDIGMQDRWEQLLEDVGLEQAEMVYEDGTPFRTILRKSKAPRIRFGVLGAGRGRTMMNYCVSSGHAELVAVCDKVPARLEEARKAYGESGGVTFYEDFEAFLRHDMDCVVLANYANEHAPFAIRCMEAGKHVLSEVLPIQTLEEAVALIETVERTGRVYAYAENYCFMPAPRKMRELYRRGVLGTFEYGEGEYMHNCEPIWHNITWGNPKHWRNTMSAFYYCTHSLGPLLHITGQRPVRVTGFEAPFNERMARMGAKAGPFGVEMVTLESGAFVKSIHGVGPSKNSIWYSIYGSKGRMESAREDDLKQNNVSTLFVNCDEVNGGNDGTAREVNPDDAISEAAKSSGHDGSDYYVMYNLVQKLRGNRSADIVDVYEAIEMFLPGMFAYQSARQGGTPVEIPNLRDPAVRERYRHDRTCTDPAVAGEQWIPSYSKGDPEIPQAVYDYIASIPQDQQNNAAWRARSKE